MNSISKFCYVNNCKHTFLIGQSYLDAYRAREEPTDAKPRCRYPFPGRMLGYACQAASRAGEPCIDRRTLDLLTGRTRVMLMRVCASPRPAPCRSATTLQGSDVRDLQPGRWSPSSFGISGCWESGNAGATAGRLNPKPSGCRSWSTVIALQKRNNSVELSWPGWRESNNEKIRAVTEKNDLYCLCWKDSSSAAVRYVQSAIVIWSRDRKQCLYNFPPSSTR